MWVVKFGLDYILVDSLRRRIMIAAHQHESAPLEHVTLAFGYIGVVCNLFGEHLCFCKAR